MRRQRRLGGLTSTLTKNASATPLTSTLTKTLNLKPFRINTYKKGVGGTPYSACRASAAEIALRCRDGVALVTRRGFPYTPGFSPDEGGSCLLLSVRAVSSRSWG